MTFTKKYDRTVTGIVTGALLPLLVLLAMYIISASGMSFGSYLNRIAVSGTITHIISLCVFPNVIIFLVYNRFDMLKACRGVLAVTIAWAVIVFGIKFLG